MNCPTCNVEMTANLEITGGCSGHRDDEYCYCSGKDVYIEFSCPNSQHGIWDAVRRRFVKTKEPCRQKPFTPPSLTDRDAIERWVQENYK